MKSKEQKSKRKNTILFLVFDIALILAGLYGIFVSLTGGMEYVNSPDKRIVNAEVVRVEYTFRRDDDGDVTGEKWKATLQYTVDGKSYTAKKVFSTKTYNGETVSIEVYKTSKGEYKVSSPSTLGFVLSAAVLLFGTMGLITENKSRQKKKAQEAKAKIKKGVKTSEKTEGGSQDGTV